MRTTRHLLATLLALISLSATAAVEVGQAAPNFTLTDLNGKSRSLSDFKGKTVVLEWFNPDCAFIQKHYLSGNMQKLQRAATSDDAVWLQINSAAPGNEGDYTPVAVAKWLKEKDAAATAYLRDQNGDVGHLYDARTTPHMFIINAAGTLVYQGAIDSIRSTKMSDAAKARNYVSAALADIKAGRPVATNATQPYGCSVKY